MFTMLLAYDASGNVVATLDHAVRYGPDGAAVALIDFEAHEAAGGKLRDIWGVQNAVGSGTWPEFLGGAAHAFRVELDADKQITALVHARRPDGTPGSGHRRERADIERAVAERVRQARARIPETAEHPQRYAADLRELVGGPGRPLVLDADGRTVRRADAARRLPLIGQD